MSRIAAVLSLVFLSVGAAWAVPSPRAPRTIAVFLEDTAPATRALASAGIAGLGGRVLHAFDDVLVVEIPEGTESAAYRLDGIREVALSAVSISPRAKAAGSTFGRAAWNAIAHRSDPVGRKGGEPAWLFGDALTPPSVSLAAVRAASRKVTKASARLMSTGAPFGATELNTSEFLAGAVSVNIVLVESDGSIELQTENWSLSREDEVVARVALGLEWIREQEPQAALHFVYHVLTGRTDPRVRTGYEPIHRAADPSGSLGEDRWVKEVLAKLGYPSGDRFARSRAFASDTRRTDGTDWAVTVFVVDSLVDPDGKFADGRFAYCWIGGPHLVMTYDNQAWGIARMDMVLRHEMLHAFYAFDEYAASACACGEHRGYLDGANANCQACNPAASACVMIQNGDALCAATRRQIGWDDLDGDGLIDVIGQDPDTFLNTIPAQVCAPPALAGLGSVVAATNRNTYPGTTHPSISVNRITGIEVRVDGAPWVETQTAGSGRGMPQQWFSAAFPELAPGPHQLEVRAVDDFGNRDLAPGSAQFVLRSPLAPLGNSVRTGRSGASGVAMTWSACGGASLYRIYRRASPWAAASVVGETASTSWSDAGAATGYYQVLPVDACGGERSD